MNCPKCEKEIIDIRFYPKATFNLVAHEVKRMPPFGFHEITKGCDLEKETYPEDKLKADWIKDNE